MLFGLTLRMAPAFIALTILSCSMQANLEEFVEEGISIVKATNSSYSQNYNNQGIVKNRSVLSGSAVTVNLEIKNPEDLDLEYEIGCNPGYIDGTLPTIAPTGPGQKSVSFSFNPSPAATGNTIVFTIAMRSPKFNKIVERGIVSIRCVSKANTDIRLQTILGDQNVTYTFNSTDQTTAFLDLTTAGTLTILPTAEVSGQSIEYSLGLNGSLMDNGNMQSGIPSNLALSADDATYVLFIHVRSPDTTASSTYTIKVPKGFTVLSGGTYPVADFIAAIANKNHIKLGGDIKLDGTANTALIANTDDEFYFDGNGHAISDMTIQGNVDDGIGLIAENHGIIKNLALENVNITCAASRIINAGGLAGCNYGTLYRCSVSGTITAASTDNVIGGLVGQMNGGSGCMAECYSTARIKGYEVCGGLAGEVYNGTILNCYARGPVSGEPSADDVGGLFGKFYSNAIVRNSYATNASTGALIGTDIGGTVTNCAYGPSPLTTNWNITNALNPAYVWGIGSGINGGYPYLQYFGAQTRLPPP